MAEQQEQEQERELAPVVQLPTQRGDESGGQGQGEVFDAELVSDEEYQRLFTQRGAALDRYQGYKNDLVRTARGVRTVATHRHTASAAKFAARHGSYALGGTAHLGRRLGSRALHGDLTEAIRTARAQGDLGQVAELEQRRREAANDRWRRVLIQLKVTGVVSGVLGGGFVATTLATLIYAVVVGLAPGGATFTGVFTEGYWAGVESVVSTLAWAASFWPYALITGLAGLVFAAWNAGKNGQMAPAAVQSNAPAQREVVNLTPSIVVKGLRDLGIGPLKAALKDDPDAGAWMLGPITRYGPGAQVQVKLPPQVNTEKIRANRNTLAGNLDRKSHEVLIECSEDSEREFTLWVADSGALDQSVPDSPLLNPDYGQVDIYRDLMPWGVSPKGEALELFLHQQHLLLAGLSKQGKTAAARSIILWLSLDPSVRLLISDLKGFGDWSMFDGLAEQLIEGSSDAKYIETADMLAYAMAEYESRMARWKAMGGKGDIDRASSQPGSGFEPMVIVIDEAQKLYTCSTEHPDGGEIGGNGKKAKAARTAQAIHDQARAANIWLVQFAQNPTNANLPAIVREGAFIRASLFVGTESVAKMALGESAVDTGAAPHALRQGKDRGTVVLAPGESMDLPGGASHTTVRTHYISTKDAYDVAERAKALRSGPKPVVEAPENRDLLADVAEVLGSEKALRAKSVTEKLRGLAPHHRDYAELTAEGLTTQLDALDVPVRSKDGYPTVRAQRVQAALAERDEEQG